MSTRKCFLMFQANPIIAAVRNPKDIHDAIASDTVSYTHLDVYKRQSADCPECACHKNDPAACNQLSRPDQ